MLQRILLRNISKKRGNRCSGRVEVSMTKLEELKERLKKHFENEKDIMRDACKLSIEDVSELRKYMWTLPHAQRFKEFYKKEVKK